MCFLHIIYAHKSAEEENKMDKKTTSIIGYLTIIGWLIAFLAGDKEGAKFHLNQSLVIILFSLVASMVLPMIPILGLLLSIKFETFTLYSDSQL